MARSKRKNKEMRLTVWELDKDLQLEEVISNLQLDYNQSIDYLADRTDIPYIDRTLQNGWHPGNGEATFKINEIQIANETIKYVHARGYYEKAESKDRAIINGDIDNGIVVPRHLRVSNRLCEAIFFELNNQVYAVIEVSHSEEGRVRSVLFGQGRKENRKAEWKKINYQDVKLFKFDSKFFYWLLSKVGKKFCHESDLNYTISLVDVSAVAQLTDKEEYDSTSKGTNILGSLPALSGLGSNQSVYEAGFSFNLPKMSLTLRISDNSTCFINLDASTVFNEKNEPVSVKHEYIKAVLTVYVILLLTLKKSYNSEVSKRIWTTSNEAIQRKQWGLFVIRELCIENEITLEDIRDLFEKAKGAVQ